MVLDETVYLVPLEASLSDVRQAFLTEDVEVHRLAKQEKFKELSSIVHLVMLWLVDRPVRTQRLDAAVVASVFGITLRRGLSDEMLAEKHCVSLYNRALSASEIAAIYNASSAGKCARPTITAEPTSQVGYWGKSVTFTVTAEGPGPLSYQWQWNGVPIAGATESSLVLTNLEATNAGNYSVVVAGAYGSTTSSNAYLTVNPAGVSLALYSGITIDGVVGRTYGLQYNTDLSNTNGWRGMANITLWAPTELWFDMQPANQAKRFYRVVPGPISIP